MNSVISLLTATVPSLIAITWQYRRSTSSENRGEKTDKQYYRHDYDTNTLQSDLEDKLRVLAGQNFKVIFVIDELDKLKETEVMETIKSLKTFFNQSSTLFILISGEEFYNKLLKNIEKRPREYTLFPQKIFLHRPMFDEMEEFIDKITSNEGETKYGEDYRRFRNYVCYASKTDFFDLYNVIRDRISHYENGNPILDIKLAERKQVIQAELQKAMGQIYSRKRYQHISDWYKNDLLLDEMYKLLGKLTRYRSGTKITITRKSRMEMKFPDENETKIVDDVVQAGALEDLLYYLEKLQFLKSEGDTYEVRGRLFKKVPKHPIIKTQEEKDFLDEYKKLIDVLSAYAEIYSQSINHEELFYANEKQIIAAFDRMGINSSLPSSPSNVRNVSELISINYGIEDRKLDDTKTPIVIEREKLEDKTQLTIHAREEYIDNFILLVQRILEKIPSIKIDVKKWSEMYKKEGIPVPSSFEDLDTTTNVILVIEIFSLKILIAQNLPLELRHVVDITRPRYNAFDILFATRTEGNFKDPVTKSLSELVTSFLDALSNPNIQSVPSRTLDLNIPVNNKLLYRLLYGVILSCVKRLEIPDYKIYEPVKEEIISSSELLASEEAVARY